MLTAKECRVLLVEAKSEKNSEFQDLLTLLETEIMGSIEKDLATELDARSIANKFPNSDLPRLKAVLEAEPCNFTVTGTTISWAE